MDKIAVIVGAGFSKNSGIPLQNEFSDKILSNRFNRGIDKVVTEIIKEFLVFTFNYEEEKMPSLEDIFTIIDLSANNGNTLGKVYNPKKLRALRRLLVYRCFQILDENYYHSYQIEKLLDFLTQNFNPEFISLNWDIVLEKHITENLLNYNINYGIKGINWQRSYSQNDNNQKIKICKVHGSSNWIYCDTCHAVYYNLNSKLSLSNYVLLEKDDLVLFNLDNIQLQAINQFFEDIDVRREKCRKCGDDLKPHIATFSYKKSFRTNVYTSTWAESERILDNSNVWLFVGYSLPFADYEFKNLLKICQLKFKSKNKTKEIHVILKESNIDSDVVKRYYAFFGYHNVKVYINGIEEYLLENIQT